MRLVLLSAGRTAFAAAFAALIVCAPAAGAQTMARPGQRAAPAPLPQRSSDDPAKVAAARQFIIVFHPQIDPRNVKSQIDRFMPRMIAAAKENNPKEDPKKVAEQRRTMYLRGAAQALDRQAHVVSRHFTLQELKALTAFYGGPLGRKLTAETPKIRAEVTREGRLERGLPARGMMGKMVVGPDSGKAQKPAASPKK